MFNSVFKTIENENIFEIYASRYLEDTDTIKKQKELKDDRNSNRIIFASGRSQQKKT